MQIYKFVIQGRRLLRSFHSLAMTMEANLNNINQIYAKFYVKKYAKFSVKFNANSQINFEPLNLKARRFRAKG